MQKASLTFKSKVVTNSVEDDWSLITPHLVSPDKVSKEQLRTWNFVIAHNGITLRGERVEKNALKSVADTLVGCPRLTAHRSDMPGDGIVYKTWTEQISYNDFIEYAGIKTNRQKFLTQKAEEYDGGLFLAWGSFYRPNVSESDKEQNFLIDSGVDKFLSVSFFFGDMRQRYESKDGKQDFLFDEFIDTEFSQCRSIEVSRVGVGNIPGAKTRTSNFYRRNKKMEFVLNDLKVDVKVQEDLTTLSEKLKTMLSENEGKFNSEKETLTKQVSEKDTKLTEMTLKIEELTKTNTEHEASINALKLENENFKLELGKLIVRNRILKSELPVDTNTDEKAKEITNHLDLIVNEWLPKEKKVDKEINDIVRRPFY